MSTAPASPPRSAGPPAANRAVVETELRRRALRKRGSSGHRRVLFLRAAPEWREEQELEVDGTTVRVAACPTVLAVLDAVAGQPATSPASAGPYLVVLTPCEPHEIGSSVLARAIGHDVHPINRADLLREAFGAKQLDPQLAGNDWAWVGEALLDAQPAAGWARVGHGAVLDFDTAMRCLVALHFVPGSADPRDGHLDAARLLEWTCDPAAVARFNRLRDEERRGFADWLTATIGPVARVVFRLVETGHAPDTLPLGVVATLLTDPGGADADPTVTATRVRMEERFLGGHGTARETLRAFGESVESLVMRWQESGRHAPVVTEVRDRAERILAELHATDLAAYSDLLAAGFDSRLAEVADELATMLPAPRPADLAAPEQALGRLGEHRLARLGAGRYADAVRSAEMAVRLARWLTVDEDTPPTVASGVGGQLHRWAWVDRALGEVWNADTGHSPRVRGAYEKLCATVRQRRRDIDEAFSERLAAWSSHAGETDELLLAENLLERIARPVATKAAPLLVLIDGMSAAVACELAEQITASRWIETGRGEGREAAVATIPSATSFSRASLLTGSLTTGGQSTERDGFRNFWRSRTAQVFHKGAVRGGAGQPLGTELAEAVSDHATVVAVVLNAVDDALYHGRESGRSGWDIDDVAYLRQLLDAAWEAQRPVILTADHGHILDRGDGTIPQHADAARYRAGEPGPGEVRLRGPRVLTNGGEVVAAWDEHIRYTARSAGYHGGVSLAEMTIPVMVFVPSRACIPTGWARPFEQLHAPDWWHGPLQRPPHRQPEPVASVQQHRPRRPQQPSGQPPAEGLFDATEAAPAAGPSLGQRVVGSAMYAQQREFLRKAPPDTQVAALIDGLAEAGGKLPVSAAAGIIGQPAVRIRGHLAMMSRLLNVDGYRVLTTVDDGGTVELNVGLLEQQLLRGEPA